MNTQIDPLSSYSEKYKKTFNSNVSMMKFRLEKNKVAQHQYFNSVTSLHSVQFACEVGTPSGDPMPY